MEKYTHAKNIKSTKPLVSLKESQGLICTPSNAELKYNPSIATRKPLTTPSFDRINNMAKLKAVGKSSSVAISATAGAKKTKGDVCGALNVKKKQQIKSTSPIVAKNQQLCPSEQKSSSEFLSTNSKSILRASASKSNERTSKSTFPVNGHASDSTVYVQRVRPKTVQVIPSGALPMPSLKKKIPGPSLDTFSFFNRKDSSSKPIAQQKGKLKGNDQTRQMLNNSIPSPYKTTKLPLITNSQPITRPRSRQTIKESLEAKEAKLKSSSTPISKPAPAPVSKPKADKGDGKCEKNLKMTVMTKGSNQKLAGKTSDQNQAATQVQVAPNVWVKPKPDENPTINAKEKPSSDATIVVSSTTVVEPSENSKPTESQESSLTSNDKPKVKSPKLKSPKNSTESLPSPLFLLKTSKSARLSRPQSARKLSVSIKVGGNVEDNFSALLLQTLKLISGGAKATNGQNTDKEVVAKNSSQLNLGKGQESVASDSQVVCGNVKIDNIDNLPFPITLSGSLENTFTAETDSTTKINPPVNTPVSPKSPTSECSEYDPHSKTGASSTTKNYYSEDDEMPNLWGDKTDTKDEMFGHDFISEYLQLESVREVNHVAQVMFRAKLCREFKGADPNLSLEQLKLTRSHYLQLPCFADAKFFTRIKVPPNVFMNRKKPDNDLLTIQYLQNKMENLSKKNLKTMEAHTQNRRNKTSQVQHAYNSTSSGSLGIGNLTKEFYIQSLHKIFLSLELPQWGKECFGAMFDDEMEDDNDEDEEIEGGHDDVEDMNGSGDANKLILLGNDSFLYKPVSTSLAEDSACDDGAILAKKILNMYENSKIKKVHNVETNNGTGHKEQEKTSGRENKSQTREFEDDASTDNQPESP